MTTVHPTGTEEEHDDDGGLHRDIPTVVGRHDMLKMMGGLSLAGLLAACNVGGTTCVVSRSPTTPAG
ncbi:MAG TPA: hypothetical protein VFS66_08980 [Acidimicrobiia bacterium]|nr:hypothetical protein [Acidimicrobiia bacterium]